MKTEKVLALLLLPCLTQMFPNHRSYKTINGVLCNMCPAGTYLNRDCNSTANPDPYCLPCKLGEEYQPDENMVRECGKCTTSCPDGDRMEITKNCTTISDTVCQCKPGLYKVKDGPEFVCLQHKECKTDEALVRKGDREMNYICEKCLNGSTYWESSTKPCQSCTNCSTELCKPFCMQADPVTTEKTAGLADWAIALIIVLSIIVVAVVVVLIVLARYKKGPKCLRDCCYGQSSTSDQENPPERIQFLPNGQIHDEIDLGAQQSNQSTSQVPVSAQQTGH